MISTWPGSAPVAAVSSTTLSRGSTTVTVAAARLTGTTSPERSSGATERAPAPLPVAPAHARRLTMPELGAGTAAALGCRPSAAAWYCSAPVRDS